MTQATNPLDDSPSKSPVFAAKDLNPNDIITDTNSYPRQYRVVFNGETEIQLERYETYTKAKQKRVTHASLDQSGFIHIGKMPGFFRKLFVNVIKF